MQTIRRDLANNPPLLMDELIAGVPTFRRVTIDSQGRDVADADSGVLEGTPTRFVVTFADNIPAASVRAVVNAHDATGRSVAQVIEAQTIQDRIDFEAGVAALPATGTKTVLNNLVSFLRGRIG